MPPQNSKAAKQDNNPNAQANGWGNEIWTRA